MLYLNSLQRPDYGMSWIANYARQTRACWRWNYACGYLLAMDRQIIADWIIADHFNEVRR